MDSEFGFQPVGRNPNSESIEHLVGMLKRNLESKHSAISTRLHKLGLAISASPPSLSKANRLFFLCGANKSEDVPSERRQAIKRFIEKLSSDYRVIYAEGIFNELAKIGGSKNVLDLEHEISVIADKIIIVLESESAYCELGAFAHHTLREKLIIINDSHYKTSDSFINAGPIAAAREVSAPVLWYPMRPDGTTKLDGVGSTFAELKTAIDIGAKRGSYSALAKASDLKPSKESLYFVHDLVLFTGPVTYDELISILVALFGKKNYDMLKRLLGVLREARLVYSYQVNSKWVYRATGVEAFLSYRTNTFSLMSSFRRFHMKVSPERFKNG